MSKDWDWGEVQKDFFKFLQEDALSMSEKYRKKLNSSFFFPKLSAQKFNPNKEGNMSKCTISKEIEFDAGHRVSTHGSKCRNPHGHRYKVRVTCKGSIIDDPSRPDHGMLVDFGDLKNIMNEKIHDVLDHGFIVWQDDAVVREMMTSWAEKMEWLLIVFPYIPTAENIARWAWEQLQQEIRVRFGGDLELEEVAVWETPTSVAYYRDEPLDKNYFYWKSEF
jgi:6-pyruvoyltetrahydropterin/6-carboxytetrahydropterin synthase